MPDLNLSQIADRLNAEFCGDTRRLVFWYDADAEFAEDVDALALQNASLLRLEPGRQLYTKYFLECVDPNTSYLIYAPFAKPALREDHLADTLRYSREFFADRASLLALDLGMDELCKPVLRQYIRFFASKERTQRFYALRPEHWSRASIETALMGALCKNKTASFEAVVRCAVLEPSLAADENRTLAQLEQFGLMPAFWRQAEAIFGYQEAEPTLERFAMALFVTAFAQTAQEALPAAWQPLLLGRAGSVVAFLEQLMNSRVYGEQYDALAGWAARQLHADALLPQLPAACLLGCQVFAEVEELLIGWAAGRLLAEDLGAMLGRCSIPELCRQRRHTHFGAARRTEYLALENAWGLLRPDIKPFAGSLEQLAARYADAAYLNDQYYRHFTLYCDQLEDALPFAELRQLAERVYAGDWLAPALASWSGALAEGLTGDRLPRQQEFYARFVQPAGARVVVIVSDALRYETCHSLYERLAADEKCTARLGFMLSVLPSYTQLGMAALLPHRQLQLADNGRVLADGAPCASLKERQAVLQRQAPKSRCVQYDALKAMGKEALREVFAGQEVVYVYHNQIDARGDQPTTENEVFFACEEAVEEIARLIRRLTTSANTSHFVITADHGFLYRRSPLGESDKIDGAGSVQLAAKRYLIADRPPRTEGVLSLPLGPFLGSGDARFVCCPVGGDIFKLPGGGQNYVHGGASPQEMLLPVLEVRTEKRRCETAPAQIELASRADRITNLITVLDFVQRQPVGELVKAAVYRVCFVDAAGGRVSSEAVCCADRTDPDTAKRVFRLRFALKNQPYNRGQRYYLVVREEQTGLEVSRREVVIDIPFADDFGF